MSGGDPVVAQVVLFVVLEEAPQGVFAAHRAELLEVSVGLGEALQDVLPDQEAELLGAFAGPVVTAR